MNKNKPRKALVGEGRSSILVKTDKLCAFGRGSKGYVLRTPGKKNKNWLHPANIPKNEKGGGEMSNVSAFNTDL